MKTGIFLLFPFFLLFIVGGRICNAQVYKWVDEKGTVHFSDSPTSGSPTAKDQSQEKFQDRNPLKPQPKSPREGVEKKQEKQMAKEGGQPSLKHLEVGSRYISEDMKKYGPGGGSDGPRAVDAPSPSVQRSSS